MSVCKDQESIEVDRHSKRRYREEPVLLSWKSPILSQAHLEKCRKPTS